MTGTAAGWRKLAAILGTKLEHWLRQCYMWITGDRPGSRDQRAYRGNPRVVPTAAEARERTGGASLQPVQRKFDGFNLMTESGDGGKRKQGDSGRKSRQGS